MRRREFITFFGSSLTGPFVALAQEAGVPKSATFSMADNNQGGGRS